MSRMLLAHTRVLVYFAALRGKSGSIDAPRDVLLFFLFVSGDYSLLQYSHARVTGS